MPKLGLGLELSVKKSVIINSNVPSCDDATAQVLMTGWVYGDRILSPIGYFPYGGETYVYGDEVVRYETGVWIYENSGLGEITRAYGYVGRPWLATWDSPFTSSKVCT